MVNPNIVASRVHKIRECVGLLKKIARLVNEESFGKDPFLAGSAERYLQVAIQSVLDICNHVVADLGLEAPSFPRLDADLLCSAISLLYMPWTWTPVAPAFSRRRCCIPFFIIGLPPRKLLSGLDTFTLDALRPAQSLSTLNPAPRGATPKTRYRDHVAPVALSRVGLSPTG